MAGPGAPRHHAQKRYGQHFLVDESAREKILELAGLGAGDRVLEIGAGRGALTLRMAPRVAELVALEIDPVLVTLVQGQLETHPNVRILEQDALQADLRTLLGEVPPLWKVVANLPYNIASRLLQKLIRQRELFLHFTVMVQKELGDRILASPDSKDYGFLSVFLQYHCRIRGGFTLPPGAFSPRPKVYSSVLQLVPRAAPSPRAEDESQFVELVKAAYAHRRKTLQNNLRFHPRFGTLWEEATRRCGMDPKRRAESLTVDEFVTLSNRMREAESNESA
ncbi:MAG: ribosomal RNA small subunit methyltransferase A [Acidobacteria bacterium]|nr:ribosomal RNA small subunit methyltransferase A [Acidobacteriota bacterium]